MKLSKGKVITQLQDIAGCEYDELPKFVTQLMEAIRIPPVTIAVAYNPLIRGQAPNLSLSALPEVSSAYSRAASELLQASNILAQMAVELARREGIDGEQRDREKTDGPRDEG